MASKVQVDAAKRDYIIKPRLDYRTVQGVNGPLVILEVRPPHASPPVTIKAPPRALLASRGHSLLCSRLLLPPPTRNPSQKPTWRREGVGRRRRARAASAENYR